MHTRFTPTSPNPNNASRPPFPPHHPLLLSSPLLPAPSPPCPHAGANASSSPSPLSPFWTPSSLTSTRRSSISLKPARSSRLMSDYRCRLLFLLLTHAHTPASVPHRAYASRMSFYRMKHFQCEVTGKSGLDYFQALESEQQEARTMQSRFPEPLKSAVLKAVQWRMYTSFRVSYSDHRILIPSPLLAHVKQRLWDAWTI